MLTRFTLILTVLFCAQPSFAQDAASKKFSDLTMLYSLTEVCYAARKGSVDPYVTESQFKETKESYTRQVSRMPLSAEEKSALIRNVKKSEEVTIMSSLIRAGNLEPIHKDCGNYRVGIILSEYGF